MFTLEDNGWCCAQGGRCALSCIALPYWQPLTGKCSHPVLFTSVSILPQTPAPDACMSASSTAARCALLSPEDPSFPPPAPLPFLSQLPLFSAARLLLTPLHAASYSEPASSLNHNHSLGKWVACVQVRPRASSQAGLRVSHVKVYNLFPQCPNPSSCMLVTLSLDVPSVVQA